MDESRRFRPGPEVTGDEELRNSRGRLIDDAYVDAAVEDALARVDGRRRRSASASAESSVLRVRLSRVLDDATRQMS